MVIWEDAMASWGATQAKAKFSEVLDKAASEGPQLVRRRKQEFFVLTREQRDALTSNSKNGPRTLPAKGTRTMSAFFRNSPLVGLDIDFKRVRLEPRHIDF
jgi:prevent-host-death family protein